MATVTRVAGQVPEAPRRTKVIRPPSMSLARLVSDIASLWQYRDLLYTLSVHRVKVRYKQSVLGLAWAMLQPLSLMLIYTLVFSVITRVPMPNAKFPYAVFAFAALLPWTFFSSSVSTATNSLVSHAQLVTKVYFPREILPLTYVIAGLTDFAIGSSILAVLMAYYAVPIGANLFYIAPVLLVLTLFATAMALLLSALQVRVRDIGVAMPLVLQLWMFLTPVVYPLSAVPEPFRGLYVLNPLVGVIENFRRVVLEGAPPDGRSFLISLLLSTALLVAAYVYFKYEDARIADVV